MPKPLAREILAAQRRRDRLAALTAAETRKLEALQRVQAELIEAVVEEHREEVLHNAHKASKIIDTMDAETSVRGARLETKHPAALRIRAVDGSIAKFAAKYKTHATTVRSWYATGEAAREIPKRFQVILEKPPYSIPRSVWRNGVSE